MEAFGEIAGDGKGIGACPNPLDNTLSAG